MLKLFSLNHIESIIFKLNIDKIIDELITEWNTNLLSIWKGPKLKDGSWRNKKWEGRFGYYKLCKNWSDQNKSAVGHKLWLPVFRKLIEFIKEISLKYYNQSTRIREQFENILTYSCLYSIFTSKVAFPRTRLLPLFLDTAMTENWQIRKFFKSFDHNINIYQFKEEVK